MKNLNFITRSIHMKDLYDMEDDLTNTWEQKASALQERRWRKIRLSNEI